MSEDETKCEPGYVGPDRPSLENDKTPPEAIHRPGDLRAATNNGPAQKIFKIELQYLAQVTNIILLVAIMMSPL